MNNSECHYQDDAIHEKLNQTRKIVKEKQYCQDAETQFAEFLTLIEKNIDYAQTVPKSLNIVGSKMMEDKNFWEMLILYKYSKYFDENVIAVLLEECVAYINELPEDVILLALQQKCLIKYLNQIKLLELDNTSLPVKKLKRKNNHCYDSNPNHELVRFYTKSFSDFDKNQVEKWIILVNEYWKKLAKPNLAMIYHYYSQLKSSEISLNLLMHISALPHKTFLLIDREFVSQHQALAWLDRNLFETSHVYSMVQCSGETLILNDINEDDEIEIIHSAIYDHHVKRVCIKKSSTNDMSQCVCEFTCFDIKYQVQFNEELSIWDANPEDIELSSAEFSTSSGECAYHHDRSDVFFPIPRNFYFYDNWTQYDCGECSEEMMNDFPCDKLAILSQIPGVKVIYLNGNTNTHIHLLTIEACNLYSILMDDIAHIRFRINPCLDLSQILSLANSFYTYSKLCSVNYFEQISIIPFFNSHSNPLPIRNGNPEICCTFQSLAIVEKLRDRWSSMIDTYALPSIMRIPFGYPLGYSTIEYNNRYFIHRGEYK